MTQVCRHQATCQDFEGRQRRAESIAAGAWIVNWICVIMLFFGLITVGKKLSDMDNDGTGGLAKVKQELIEQGAARDVQIQFLTDRLADVAPKDVLPHVLKIEEMVKECRGSWTAAVEPRQ